MAYMGFVALVAVTLGTAYIGCCAQVTSEGYRKARLVSQLNHERELLQWWRHQRALIYTPNGGDESKPAEDGSSRREKNGDRQVVHTSEKPILVRVKSGRNQVIVRVRRCS